MPDEEHDGTPPGHRYGSAREGMAKLVSVAELIRRQPESLRATLPGGGSADEGPHDPADHDAAGEPAPVRTSVRVAAGAAAVCLLLGAASVTSVLLSRAPTSTDDSPVTRARPVAGTAALRPDVLMARVGWSPTPEAAPSAGLPLPGVPLPGSEPDGVRRQDSASLLRANPSAGSPQGAVDLVRDFYRLLDRDPRRAAALVAPRLLGTGADEFARAWRAVESVRTHRVRPGAGGSVVAKVSATSTGGGHLVLRHELTVETSTSTPRIVRAELLAAELHRD